jgi:hypothetical protein
VQIKDLLSDCSKAQLQSYYLHWFSGKEMISARERLEAELGEAMTDATQARSLFDSLPRAQQGFVISLLLRDEYSGTVAQVREQKHGRVIEDFQVEITLKGLQESGYIAKTTGTGGYANEVFTVAKELAVALRRTISVDERQPMEMLSLKRFLNAQAGSGDSADVLDLLSPEAAKRRLEQLPDDVRPLIRAALEEHGGILTHSLMPSSMLSSDGNGAEGASRADLGDLRRKLEVSRLGTTGVLSLRDFGIGLEEDGILVFQEIVREISLAETASEEPENDREVSLGADLVIDVERALEILRVETLERTREGNVYKKIEERLSSQFVTSHFPELHDGSPLGHIVDLCRRLQLLDEEGQRIRIDPIRRRVWRKKALLAKVEQIFDLYRSEKPGQRWSFHQTAIRKIFIEQLRRVARGSWLVARPFLTAVIAEYLLCLEKDDVREKFQELCNADFRNENVVVPLPKLYHDLSYWVLHRLALLGVVDIGYKEGAFHSLRFSKLGRRLFGETSCGSVLESDDAADVHMLVNPDFEILIYPEAPEEVSWTVSLFADRLAESDRVKRYQLTRESVKRGMVAGQTPEEMVEFLEANARGTLPPNVVFSVREWTAGVELVRLQKVELLRAQSGDGADRLGAILESKQIPYERLNDTIVMVRGGKNERAAKELQGHFRDHGLFVE